MPTALRNRWIIRSALGIVGLLVAALLSAFMLLYFMTSMPGARMESPLPKPTPAQALLANSLNNHVDILATVVGPRHGGLPDSLDRAGDYVTNQFRNFGYAPEEIRFGDDRFRNIQATLPGTDRADEILVVGAHYDSAANGTPGADDNASGVAVMLEIARALAGTDLRRTVRFIAFANEENPWFGTDLMGSRISAGKSAQHGENIVGMFSLEMLGYYDDTPGSQKYPRIIRRFYPDTGNFVAFVGNMQSRPLLHQALRVFRESGVMPSEGMAAPQALVRDIRRSDNSAYWDAGYPALMVTDTSNFRNPLYHTLGDTPKTLDYTTMARLTEGLTGMVITLANAVE